MQIPAREEVVIQVNVALRPTSACHRTCARQERIGKLFFAMQAIPKWCEHSNVLQLRVEEILINGGPTYAGVVLSRGDWDRADIPGDLRGRDEMRQDPIEEESVLGWGGFDGFHRAGSPGIRSRPSSSLSTNIFILSEPAALTILGGTESPVAPNAVNDSGFSG
ncbi:uncharacterized protein EI90DRAFT_3022376 [Cantharellus anzutake]|uniref:uncharacterized protein n=1 Tax=Cantharellus anzutake TaxID=1750568 RepID=UPI0019070BD5|nr:uncharacterized protein EI90DRAFT_3022376 [Cantharellus anzutake]KAF8314372.1 hypothetical protein EI90DRAFT_3022376 [Cantharellus anzutake]